MELFIPPWLSIVILGLVGLAYGSFGTVVVARMAAGELPLGRSRCPACRRTLHPWELVPILSFALQGGRCRRCRAAIAPEYLLLELGSMALFLLTYALSPSLPAALALGAALCTLMFAAAIDLRTQAIPDVLTILLLLFALLRAWLVGGFHPLAPVIGLLFFGLQWALSRGRWVGSGDVLLAGAIGVLVLSVRGIVVSILAAYIVGAVFTAALLLLGRVSRKDYIAFGPFLAVGALIALLERALPLLPGGQ